MARFNRSTGRTNEGINWDLHTLPSNQFYGAGIRRWDGNEYFYGLMNNGSRVLGLYHWGNGRSSFGRYNNNTRNGYSLYVYNLQNYKNDYYFGNYVDGKKHGRGLYIFANGSWFYGDWVKDTKHGVMFYYSSNDGYLYYQKYNNDQRVVSEKINYYLGGFNAFANQTLRPNHLPYSQMEYYYRHDNQSDYEFNGNTYNGYWDGYCCFEWTNMMFMGEYTRGVRGTGAFFYTNGSAYFGQTYNNYYSGFGTLFYNNNEYYVGQFSNGYRHGLGLYISSDGRACFSFYRNGKAEGKGINIWPSNSVTVDNYKEHKYVSRDYTFTPGSAQSTSSNTQTKSTPTRTTTTTTTTTKTTPTKTTKPRRRKTFKELGVKDPYVCYDNLVGQLAARTVFDDVLHDVNTNNVKHNMIFIGKSGTGKSYIGNIYAGVLYDKELSKNAFAVELDIEESLRSLNGTELVKQAFKDAKDSALIINNITCLNAFTTFRRSDIELVKEELDKNIRNASNISIIYTCYDSEEDDLNTVIEEYLKRIDYTINFSDYSESEFRIMAENYIKEQGYKIEDDALDLIVDKVERNRRYRSFANAKDLMSVLKQAIENCKARCEEDYDPTDDEYTLIIDEDIFRIAI